MAVTRRDADIPTRLNEPEPQMDACSAMVEDELVMYGGWLPSYRGLEERPPLHHVEVFNCNLSQWTQRRTTGTLPPPLQGSACTCISHLLYMFGGWTGHSFSDCVYELHVTTSCWRELHPVNPKEGPMPKCRCGIINISTTTLCVIGGYGIPTGSLQPGSKLVEDERYKDGRGWSNEIHSFDIPSGLWRVPPTTGQGPPAAAAFTFTRVDLVRAVFFGGDNAERMRTVAAVFLLNFETWHWTALLPTGPSQLWPVGRDLHTAFSLYDPNSSPPHPCLAMACGMAGDGTPLRDMWALTIDEQYWEEISLPPTFTARWYHTGGVTHRSASQATAVFFGGSTDNPTKCPSYDDIPCIAQTTAVDLVLESSKAISGKPIGWTASVKDSTALAMQVLYDQALTHGYIESRSIISVLTGAAGSGKTHVKHLLFKKKPPVIRISTALMESPVRAVSLTRVNTDDDDWHEIDDDEQCRMIAAALSTGDIPTKTASESTSQEKVEAQQPQSSDVPPSTAELQSAKQTTTTSRTNPLSTNENIITPSTQQPSLPQLTTESALTSQADQEPDDSGVREELIQLMLTSSGSKKLLQADRIYLFDTGGQTIFHELLRLFLRRESVTIFVTKLNERLDHHPMIEYYGKEGKLLNRPHPSPLTHEDILKYSFRAVQSQAYTADESQETNPKLLVVGTHRDKEWRCTETREKKNEKLLALLAPAFQKMLLYYGEEIKELIFPVNAKNPGRQDQEVAKDLRKAVLSAMSSLKSHKTPLAWHILEIALRKLAASIRRSILSRQECLRVARKLHLSEEQLDAALYHFTQLNLILYYQSHAVFTDPQIIFDKVTDLVQYSYRLQCKPDKQTGTSGELLAFRDEGVITLKLLKRFRKHYVPEFFSPSDLLSILEHQLIIAHISEGKYFMPSLLLDLPGKQVERHRVEPSSPAAPFVIYFPGGLAPCGIFCALVASLLSPLNPLHWKLLPSHKNFVSPACVARNCIEFQLPEGYPVALIDSYTHYEVHVFAPGIVCSEVCPQIRNAIFQSLNFAAKALHYTNLTPKPAFLCEFSEVHVEEESTPAPLTWQQWLFGRRPTEKAAPTPHIARFSTSNGNRWTCSRNPGKAHGKLQERHMIWLRAADSSTACSQSQLAPLTSGIREVNRTIDYPSAQNRDPPSLLKLIRFRGQERRINIPQEIGVHYITFGTLLLEDYSGMRVRSMERKHMRDAEQINLEVFQEWVEGRGKQPVTWDTLIDVLRDTQLTELAIEIASVKAV